MTKNAAHFETLDLDAALRDLLRSRSREFRESLARAERALERWKRVRREMIGGSS